MQLECNINSDLRRRDNQVRNQKSKRSNGHPLPERKPKTIPQVNYRSFYRTFHHPVNPPYTFQKSKFDSISVIFLFLFRSKMTSGINLSHKMSILCHYLLAQYVTCLKLSFRDINHVTLTINKSVPNCAILNRYDSYPVHTLW